MHLSPPSPPNDADNQNGGQDCRLNHPSSWSSQIIEHSSGFQSHDHGNPNLFAYAGDLYSIDASPPPYTRPPTLRIPLKNGVLMAFP